MADVLVRPNIGSGKLLVDLISRIVPDIKSCRVIEIRLAVDEAITFKIERFLIDKGGYPATITDDELQVVESSYQLVEVERAIGD